jgi:hypothetical protein
MQTCETFENMKPHLTYRARSDWVLLHELQSPCGIALHGRPSTAIYLHGGD